MWRRKPERRDGQFGAAQLAAAPDAAAAKRMLRGAIADRLEALVAELGPGIPKRKRFADLCRAYAISRALRRQP